MTGLSGLVIAGLIFVGAGCSFPVRPETATLLEVLPVMMCDEKTLVFVQQWDLNPATEASYAEIMVQQEGDATRVIAVFVSDDVGAVTAHVATPMGVTEFADAAFDARYPRGPCQILKELGGSPKGIPAPPRRSAITL